MRAGVPLRADFKAVELRALSVTSTAAPLPSALRSGVTALRRW